MPKFAANLSMMFQEVDFLDRFEKAAKAGFEAVEFLFPYEYDKAQLAALLEKYQLKQVLFNTAPGDVSKGEWGLTAIPGREADAREMIDSALEYAIALKCKRVHVMAGVVPEGADKALYRHTFIENMRYASEKFKAHNLEVVIEALSPPIKPNYLFHSQHEAVALLKEIDRENVGLQYDFFHAQLVDGNIANFLQDHIGLIKHIQIASVPYRHEPDQGELNYCWLFGLLDELGYNGWVGCEYKPKTTTEAGLNWFNKYRSAKTVEKILDHLELQ
ncbi:hydroxypyruvate isomerase family protein [Ignatzschineria rhizosphaerae]|uniref:Hydroxypyruvate isomerase family protein n=1 Tax=Ignatzschineria rhizosphaerae TaxID=2923279 RepID=A0ABY3WWE8_9GAMM|nr:2-oxo-tetronate isomerase [Ignatzschineria rhizosphaerae]UNM94958.1 hydroxypyruvate isomerase family protein [Ignatzschineria rhizosphaerae]